jgi:alanine racemase
MEGVFTHFAEAEVLDPTFTEQQMARFDTVVAQIKAYGVNLKYVHATNSPSTVRFKQAHYNMVRTGLLWLGYDPCADAANRLELEPVLEWRAFVTSLKRAAKGIRLGYNRGCTTTRDSLIAIGSFGYGDGYLEDLGKKGGYVLIRGQKAPLISVCMDQTFIDVTDVARIRIDDAITLIGRDGAEKIDAFDMEKITGNSYVYYLSSINDRPVKTYLR